MPSRDTCSTRTQDAGTSHESVNLKAPENFKSQTFVVFALVRWRSSSPCPGYCRPGAALDSKFHSVALNSPASEVVQRHLAYPFKAKMQPVNKIITSMKRDKHWCLAQWYCWQYTVWKSLWDIFVFPFYHTFFSCLDTSKTFRTT